MIYFVRRSDGAIKIGCTEFLTTRLVTLKRELNGLMDLLAVMDGGFAEEQALHRRFDAFCLGNAANHEWFSPSDELLDYIRQEGRSMTRSDGCGRIGLELLPEQRDKLRVLAARHGMSMATFARTVVAKAIEKGGGE